jgi:hypothetical protein
MCSLNGEPSDAAVSSLSERLLHSLHDILVLRDESWMKGNEGNIHFDYLCFGSHETEAEALRSTQ